MNDRGKRKCKKRKEFVKQNNFCFVVVVLFWKYVFSSSSAFRKSVEKSLFN